MNNQIVTYIDEQGLLASGISGYRRGHSATTVLLRIRDDVIKAMKRGEVTMMVCADYSKAFDTVQFKAVLMKMHGMGFSKKFLRWVLNYLCGATTICSNRRCVFWVSHCRVWCTSRLYPRSNSVQFVRCRPSRKAKVSVLPVCR